MSDKLSMSHIVYFILYLVLLGSSFIPHLGKTKREYIYWNYLQQISTALASSCQVYPSEYAYRDDSVTRAESARANCRSYPPREGDMRTIYTHCDGQQLKLSDSDRGLNTEYTATSYYEWTAGSDGQLVFIFPTRVSLTTIILHYYSDSVRGRPTLRIYAVPDDFNVWDPSTISTPYVDVDSVPPGGGPAGRRNVSINFNFDTKKVLVYKYSSRFKFAVSEVEFFKRMQAGTIIIHYCNNAIVTLNS